MRESIANEAEILRKLGIIQKELNRQEGNSPHEDGPARSALCGVGAWKAIIVKQFVFSLIDTIVSYYNIMLLAMGQVFSVASGLSPKKNLFLKKYAGKTDAKLNSHID